ncbi:hypothetical protein HFN97_26120 [Rhizobium laguerreae]|uniref:hypothetical protein n=1 Tax=Rhizobium laguerreae TaxID=1076926 RepID=UPI001C90EE15|nr:hypothetical protein [Rhizobium laguerreae]MBY3361252.1 hypothetical protein [Rhizobium laguerreae]
MSFRKLSYNEADFDSQIVIAVLYSDGKTEASLHHPFESATRVGLEVSHAIDLALHQQAITPDNPEVVVIDEDGLRPSSFAPLI